MRFAIGDKADAGLGGGLSIDPFDVEKVAALAVEGVCGMWWGDG